MTVCATDGRAGGVGRPHPLELSQSRHDLQMLVIELQDLTPSPVDFALVLV